jgi:hypothetical protein
MIMGQFAASNILKIIHWHVFEDPAGVLRGIGELK